MGLYTGYDGKGLNHVELLYQRGERDLASNFLRMLGCAIVPTSQINETGSTYIVVHPDPSDTDGLNNVLYLSEIRAAQWELESLIVLRLDKDEELAEALDAYKTKARTKPHGIPHFGLRFPSFESIEPVLEALESCDDPALKNRFSVSVVRPGDPGALYFDIIQAFVYTDVVATGPFYLGQLIELQAQRSVD